MRTILAYFFATFLIVSAMAHLLKPEIYALMIPDFIPATFANISSFIVELVIGMLLLLPRYRHLGGLGFALLMIAFFPIHVWDYTKEVPMMGSKPLVIVRLIFQVLFIYLGLWIYKTKERI